MDFREYLSSVSPVPAAGRLHVEPGYLEPDYDLRSAIRGSGKPVLVLFEQKECPPCDELHLDILKRPESQEQLRRFDVVLLDMWSNTPVVTPAGQKTTAQEWARALNVQYAPSMVFFEDGGSEVFRSEAYLKAFHIQSVMDYAASGSYRDEPEFQRYIDGRAKRLEAQGVHVDLMK
jgi:thioredoxin-related protein